MALKGVEETIRHMKKFANDVQKSIIDGMDESTAKILDDGKKLAPVLTGKLKDSGRRKITRKRVWFTGTVGFYTRYAYYQEFGFHHWRSGVFVSPKPYLWPAVTQNRQFILDKLGRHLEHAIEKNDYRGQLMRKRLI